MSWYQEWQALSARIKGLLDAGTFFYGALQHSSSDDMGVRKKVLLAHAENIFTNLNGYLEKFRSTLPEKALESIESFLTKPDIKNFNFNPDSNMVRSHVQFALTSLSAFQSEFSYIISDTQAVALKNTERAFLHLNRSIVVDDEIKRKWLNAFKMGETNCEKIGALHLLSHGIWAFKAYAERARTDLILNEPLSDISMIEKTSIALVLTEWKIVKKQKEIHAKIKEAHEQTKIYKSGVLGGIELTDYRYLVMVSEKSMKMPPDIIDGKIIYRLVNIAVNPDTPSIEAKKTKIET
jgi:hypothetical protein